VEAPVAAGDAGARVAIVTGGSRGIGRAIAVALGARGFRVVATARTAVSPATDGPFARYAAGTVHETAAAIAGWGGTAVGVPCDVTRADDLRRLVDTTLERYGRIDVLVHNAGVDCEARVPDLEVDVLDRCLAVNVRAPLLLCKYALPAMIARGAGSIIGITSGAARAYRPQRVGYSMSKAALERAFLGLAEELRPHDIAVNCLSPGRIDTWMNRGGDWPGTAHIPLEPPEVVAPAAVWLAEQTAATFTGQVVERAEFGLTWGRA
jgi:NAD(P)-dependent dehydrogenase (short-subunit alcohol dehydrogenase family)